MIRNKARLVAQGYTQEEGTDYDEVFALVARIKAIRIEDPEFPNKVYKVEKALYGLHQAPRACQEKYVDEILKNFGFSTVKTASTPMETSKPLLKDAKAEDADIHLYRSMIGSLMYLTASRPDIMFVTLESQPKLGLWYPKNSPFDLEAYTDSDYVGASLDRKSTTGVKNLVFHSNTKHIEIRHHFIRDSNEKKPIQMIKIHTDHNVADLLTKAFDVGRFQYLIASIRMLNS
ncbi:putative reverse transcriptase, RNA-dependent DNA polymerase [Tanacetum coccineum]